MTDMALCVGGGYMIQGVNAVRLNRDPLPHAYVQPRARTCIQPRARAEPLRGPALDYTLTTPLYLLATPKAKFQCS